MRGTPSAGGCLRAGPRVVPPRYRRRRRLPECSSEPAGGPPPLIQLPTMPYVMIVDDARDSVEPLASYLERTGYLVCVVTDPRDALAEIIRNPPQVLLLDLLMPGMDGAMLLGVIRSYLRLSLIPVVILTGAPDSPLVERVKGLRVHSVLTKGKSSFRDIEAALRLARHHVPGGPPSEN